MIDLSTLTSEQLHELRVNIDGELAKRAGKPIDLRYSATPKGGAILYDRPAIGGDRDEDWWYPTLEAANAALLDMAGSRAVRQRSDGGLYYDYTAQGCNQSFAQTKPND